MAACLQRLAAALASLDLPLRVAQTRLKRRGCRPQVENCADEVYHSLVAEVKIVTACLKKLEAKHEEAKAAHSNLSKNIQRMEDNLKMKKNSLFIDLQKCMSMRRTFPFIVVSSRHDNL